MEKTFKVNNLTEGQAKAMLEQIYSRIEHDVERVGKELNDEKTKLMEFEKAYVKHERLIDPGDIRDRFNRISRLQEQLDVYNGVRSEFLRLGKVEQNKG